MKLSTKARIRNYIIAFVDIVRRTPFAVSMSDVPDMPHSIMLKQPFMPSETLEAKKHNLRTAAELINKVVVAPGKIFSFWHVVGNPNDDRRFMPGRSIHGKEVALDYGGGLCQASGILHHLALIAGVEVVERHSHSMDLYTENTRFAPLGTDATVFYGYKDLRLRNNTGAWLRFELQVDEHEFTARLFSSAPLTERNLRFEIKTCSNGCKHVVITDSGRGIISESKYKPYIKS